MKIFITGSSGFLGSHLSECLLRKGHQVIGTGTRPKRIRHDHFQYIQTDTTKSGPWQDALKNVDAVVNLAGQSIFNLWTKGYKKRIYDTRVQTTRHIVDALPENKTVTCCSASAVGYYGNRGDDILTEDDPNGDGFLAKVCRDWEAEALRAGEKGGRVVVMRFGVVLGKDGGAMKQMLPAFRFCIGGPLGGGAQWFPWVHLDDLLSAILFLLEDEKANGPFNITSPGSVRQGDFAKTLGQVLKRPTFIPAPAFLIRLIMGEFGTSILASQRAIPDRLSTHGFQFTYPALKKALEQIVSC